MGLTVMWFLTVVRFKTSMNTINVHLTEESAALAVNNGCDLNCGRVFTALQKAVEQG